ncbi:MAG: PilZ domain-containing protein [Myxococcota bacterium]
MNEARAHRERAPRYPIRVSCELTCGGDTFHAETRNLSTGGAAIRFEKELQVGEVVTVSFFLTQDGIEDPDRDPFECAASVRWTKPAGTGAFASGLQFLSPSNAQRDLLRDFIAQTERS